ncbi:hypothetical protein ADUPG1_000289 [Aduncisulcus paluster]|uniref:peptidylprolyl isomerase n=1 Tax=Aduncisulcus paluster TaxID=2918883 RepID=A0ABQ5JZS0_9EUKA|nr:hypothetical protein ADUPG1_012539 [Aduncisulcus paluster]GKT27926.1 hypothetical protein ADUPG1_000289 [Aduncisulcus paluster]
MEHDISSSPTPTPTPMPDPDHPILSFALFHPRLTTWQSWKVISLVLNPLQLQFQLQLYIQCQFLIISGWDEAFLTLSVGERATIVIKSILIMVMVPMSQAVELAIPPDSTLIFDVELLGIKK